MKKSILSLLTISATLAFSVPLLPAQAEGNIVVGANELSIVLPGSYEEYLPLSTPADVAMNDRYITVADGNSIHVYNRAENLYHTYQHTANSDNRLNTVSAMEFSPSDGYLYFSDASTSLYILDCSSLTSFTTRLSCSSFTIYEDVLYYSQVTSGLVSISEINTTILAGGQSIQDEAHLINRISSTATPAMAVSGENLYYAIGNKLYSNAYDYIAELTANGNVQDIAFSGSDKNPWYTDSMGNLYHYDLAMSSVISYETSTYSSLCAFKGCLYVIDGKSVLEYDASQNEFTDYEISSYSSGKSRLSRASDMLVTKDKLIIADRGNRRVSITDLNTEKTTVFPTIVEPDLIAHTDDKILVSNGSAISIHSMQGEELYQHTSFLGVIVGVTGVYGNFYLVTGNNYHYSIDADYNLVDSYKALDTTAKQLTSDIDGSLYVLYLNGNVSRYLEQDFMNPTGTNTSLGKFPNSVSKIYTDFAGNVYGMYQNYLYYLDNNLVGTYEFKPDGSVYASGITANAYAISYEDKAVYLLCGDFVVKTDVLNIGTLNDVVAGSVGKEIVNPHTNAEPKLYETNENTVFITFDEKQLAMNPYFSYQTYHRVKDSKHVALLGETQKYYVVSLFNQEQKRYETALVKKEYCNPVSAETNAPFSIAYTTTPTKLYKFPFVSDALVLKTEQKEQVVTLDKSTIVTVLSTVKFENDYDYYRVSVTIDHVEYIGYLPTTFLHSFNGSIPEETLFTNTYLNPDQAVVFIAKDGQLFSATQRIAVTAYGDTAADQVLVSLTRDGVTYYASVSSSLLVSATEGRWRIMSILVIAVLIVMIIADYYLIRKKQ